MNNFKSILQQFLKGTLSAVERDALKKWVAEKPENLAAFKQAIRKYDREQAETFDADKAFETFAARVGAGDGHKGRVIRLRWYRVAAVFVGILMAFYGYKRFGSGFNTKEVPQQLVIKEKGDSVETVTLKLANGTIKTLRSDRDTTFAAQGGRVYASQSGNTLNFFKKGEQYSGKAESHTISVPNGKTFKLLLSDSTVVWLNAGTRLTFPEWFDQKGTNRVVSLEGEAYFDVQRNEQLPFLVRTSDVEVRVLGTAFNVSSYSSDSDVTTTLVEGSVALRHMKSAEKITIRPTIQARFTKTGTTFDTAKVDTDIYTAWMQDKLVFTDATLDQMVQRLERFYDITIIDQTTLLENETFRGAFRKDDKLEDVLEVLATSTAIRYHIDQKTITLKN